MGGRGFSRAEESPNTLLKWITDLQMSISTYTAKTYSLRKSEFPPSPALADNFFAGVENSLTP
jgi:hypothetical protein